MKQFCYRLLMTNLLGGSLMAIYLLINQRVGVGHMPVTMPDGVLFLPSMALPYLMMLVLPLFFLLLIQDQTRFHRSLLAIVIGFAVISFIWIFYPTEMLRPEIGNDSHAVIYQVMIGVDRPVNIFPCGHVLWPIVSIFFLGQERRSWLKFLRPLFLFGTITVVTTWQHRPVDILVGTAISLGAIWVATKVKW